MNPQTGHIVEVKKGEPVPFGYVPIPDGMNRAARRMLRRQQRLEKKHLEKMLPHLDAARQREARP